MASARPLTRRACLLWGGAIGTATACSGVTQSGGETGAPAHQPVTVRVHARTGSEDEAYARRLAEFTTQNKRGIKAEYEGWATITSSWST
jgi:hypothetical protein